jgi:hypothetical protein
MVKITYLPDYMASHPNDRNHNTHGRNKAISCLKFGHKLTFSFSFVCSFSQTVGTAAEISSYIILRQRVIPVAILRNRLLARNL